jgi:hypothetical protein
MKLITKEVLDRLPKLYSQDGKPHSEVKIIVKFFDPCGSWSWYASEGDVQEDGDIMFFGLVDGFEKELGNFSLNELMSVRGPMGLRIERDLHYGFDHTLAEVMGESVTAS